MKKVFLAILFLCSFLSAAYILQLEYDGQKVVQKGVYYSELAQVPEENEGGIYSVNLGLYESNFSFSVLRAYDDEQFSDGKVEKLQKTQKFIVVPEVVPHTMLRVEKEGKVLLDQEIEEPQYTRVIYKPIGRCENDWDCSDGLVCEQSICVEESGGFQCEGDADCPQEQYCVDGKCSTSPVCMPLAGFIVGLAIYAKRYSES